MNDELYFRRRAAAEARLAEASRQPEVQSIHQEMSRAYRERAEALSRGPAPAR